MAGACEGPSLWFSDGLNTLFVATRPIVDLDIAEAEFYSGRFFNTLVMRQWWWVCRFCSVARYYGLGAKMIKWPNLFSGSKPGNHQQNVIHPDAVRLRSVIDLFGIADGDAQAEFMVRLYRASQLVIDELGCSGMLYSELKLRLSPQQARKVADRTRQIGVEVARAGGKFGSNLDEAAFMFVAASLWHRSGATWIESPEAKLVDGLLELTDKVRVEKSLEFTAPTALSSTETAKQDHVARQAIEAARLLGARNARDAAEMIMGRELSGAEWEDCRSAWERNW